MERSDLPRFSWAEMESAEEPAKSPDPMGLQKIHPPISDGAVPVGTGHATV